nr:ribonuclease H-like domain-containing protein [Tanacetum cinerariifolium]
SARNSGSRNSRNVGYKGRDNGKRPVKEEDEQALVVQDGLGTYEQSYQVEEEATDFALMAFTSNPSSSSCSNSEDLEQIDQDDLEEMNLKWQVAMLSMRVKRFYKKTRRKLKFNGKNQLFLTKTRNVGYKGRDNGKRPVKEEDEQALVVQDGLGTYEQSYQVEEEATDFALMAFTSNPSSSSCSNSELDKKDLEQIDQDDLEEMNLKWQVAMLSMRVKRFYKKTRRKLKFNGKNQLFLTKTRNVGYKGRDNGKRPVKEEDEQALVVQDGLGTYEQSYQVEEEATDFALMAFTSNPSSSSCSNSE